MLKQYYFNPEQKIAAITLHQPWASLIAFGLKEFETRAWKTSYRGKLLIHAGKERIPDSTLEKMSKSVDLTNLTPGGWISLPRGVIVAVCDLVDCIQITEKSISLQSEQELDIGFWKEGRYAWKLVNVVDLQEIKPTLKELGDLGLWKPSETNVKRVEEHLDLRF